MDEKRLRSLIKDLRDGSTTSDEAVAELKRLPFADLGFAKLDHHRPLRQSLPEAVYGPGKTVEQCNAIVGELLAHGTGPVIVTRASDAQIDLLVSAYPNATRYERTIVWRSTERRAGSVAVLTAGTGDLPVANECIATLVAQGISPALTTDCGVAGVHRLLATLDTFENLDALVVVAGMEGALASVAGGITAAPVIAVPTSVGYGSSFEGITALLAMLSSCAAGVTVVGIDNGFGAACAVSRILTSKGL